MNLYFFVLSICLILITFTVGESVLKGIGLSRKFVIISLLILLVCSFIPVLKIFGVYIQASYLAFFLLACFCISTLRSRRMLVKTIVLSCIFCLTTICYYSIVRTSFEFMFFQPYYIVFAVVGALCVFYIKNIKIFFLSGFIGLNLGYVTLFELSNIFANQFVIGEQMIFDCLLASCIAFSIFNLVFALVRVKKYKKIENRA